MNTYSLQDLYVGLSAEFTREITSQMMAQFLEITGDCSPIHVNLSYAQQRGFSQTVVYGLLTGAFYSTLVGVYLPGKNALLQRVDLSFVKPVFVGDILKIRGKVMHIHEVYKQIELSASIFNQNDEKVSRAKIWVGCHE